MIVTVQGGQKYLNLLRCVSAGLGCCKIIVFQKRVKKTSIIFGLQRIFQHQVYIFDGPSDRFP